MGADEDVGSSLARRREGLGAGRSVRLGAQ